MPIKRTNVADNQIGPEKVTQSIRKGRYFRDHFFEEPHAYAAGTSDYPGDTDATVHILDTGTHLFQVLHIGTQTIVSPVLATDGGLDIGLDQTLDEGLEINFGHPTITGHPRNFTTGTDASFYFRARLSIEDVSGPDLFVGFRKTEANQAALATYTDIFGLQVLGASGTATGAINILTNLNDATDITSTDTGETLSDTDNTVELEVRCVGRKAQFFIDGVPTDLVSFTADDADTFCPIIRHAHKTDVAGQVKLLAVEGGLLADRPDGLLTAA